MHGIKYTYFFASVLMSILLATSSAYPSELTQKQTSLYPYRSMIELQDEFIGGVPVSGSIGDLGWSILGGGTLVQLAPETDRYGLVRRATSAAAGTVAQFFLFGNNRAYQGISPHQLLYDVRLNTNDANTQIRIGEQDSTVPNPATRGTYFEKLDGDTNWFCVTRDVNIQTRTDSGIAVDTSFHTFEFFNKTSTLTEFMIDNVLACTNTTNITPGTLSPIIQMVNSAASDKTFDVDYFHIRIMGITR